MLTHIAMDPALQERFGNVRVLGRRLELDPLIHQGDGFRSHWECLHLRWRGTTKAHLRSTARIAAYREFNRTLGLDPNRVPPSVENLIKRFLQGAELTRVPTINPIVDAINVAAVETLVPLGGFDADAVVGELVLGMTSGGEPFQPLGANATEILAEDLVVLRDNEKVLSRFAYRDSEVQKITATTARVWVLGCQVPGVAIHAVAEATERAIELLSSHFAVQELAEQS